MIADQKKTHQNDVLFRFDGNDYIQPETSSGSLKMALEGINYKFPMVLRQYKTIEGKNNMVSEKFYKTIKELNADYSTFI